MADPTEEALVEANVEESPTAAVYAAMMEELGLARKDNLPLDDKKGLPGRVDLDALDRGKKAFDPRTAEYKIAKENESARLAWRNAEFGDVDPKVLTLDQLDSGQSHRLRMKSTLEASHRSRGGHAAHGARGAQIARGGGSHSLSRLGRSNRRSDPKSDKSNVDRALSRLGARSVSNVMARSGIRGATRSSNSKLASCVGDNSAPKRLFSFHDIKEGLGPGTETREVQAARKVLKPNNYNQGFGLASPEDFLSQGWACTSRSTDLSNVKGDNLSHDDLLVAARNTQKVATTKPKIENRSVQELVEPSTILVDLQQKIVKPVPGDLINTIHDVFHSSLVQIGNNLGGKVIMIGSGSIHIKMAGSSPQMAKVIQIEHEGKICLEEPLLESIEFQLETRTVSFHAGHEGRIKWILVTPNLEAAANLLASLEQHKSTSTHVSSCNASSKGHTGDVATLVKAGDLISYLEEGPASAPMVSKFREDLLSLMGDPPIEDIVVNTQIKQDAQCSIVSVAAVNSIVGEIPKQQNAFRGLATSRYAKKSELFGLANSSTPSQNSLESSAAKTKKKIGKRVSKKTQKNACDNTALDTIKQGQPRQYTIEELISLKPPKNLAKTSSPPVADLKCTSESGPRFFFRFPELKGPSISTRKIIQQPSRLKSKHTKPHTKNVLEDVAEPGDATIPISKPAQELSHPKSPDKRAPGLIPKPLTEKIRSYGAEQLIQEPKNSAKSGPLPTDLIRGFPESTPNPYHAVNTFQSLAKSTGPKDFNPRSTVELLTSTLRINLSENKNQFLEFPITPEHRLTDPFKELSISDHVGPAGSKGIAEYSKLIPPEQQFNKPYQGLSTSRYANPSQLKRKMNPVASTTTRIRPKTSRSVNKLSTSIATVPGVIDEIASCANMTHENSNRRESSISHTSKCSDQTVRLRMQVSSIEPDLDQDLSLRSSHGLPNHQSLLSTDSLGSCTSIKNTVENLVNTGATKLTYFQPGTSDFVLFPNSNTEVNTGVTPLSVESGYSTDMSELIEKTQSVAPQSLPSNAELATTALPKSSAIPLRKTFERPKTGLMSSRYATAHNDVALGVETDETQSYTPNTVPTVKHSSNTQRSILGLSNRGPELSHRPRVLQPTASQFTPSTARDSIETHNLPAPVMSPLSPPMQPPIATVLVPDPQRPGFLTEVCGYLKMSSTPIVGFFVNENFPTGESLASAAGQASIVSPVPVVNTAEKIALSLIPQDSKSVTEKQQEIQERLLMSLAKRRLSRSPGHSGH